MTIAAGTGVWVLQRLVLIVVMARDGGVVMSLTRWDAAWYAGIASGGYHWPGPLPGHANPWISDLAFLPGLPAVGRVVVMTTGLSPRGAILLAAQVGFLLAAAAVTALGARVAGPAPAVLLTACWGAAPRAVVESMGYAEGWFIALVALALLAVVVDRWVLAGALVAVSGLFRASVVPVGIVLGLAWLTALFTRVPAPERRRRFMGAALSPLGLCAWMAVVAHRTGRWNGYFLVQRAWGSGMGSPAETVAEVQRRLNQVPVDWRYFGLIALTWCLYLLLGIVMAASRERAWLTVYVLVTVVFVGLMQGYFHSKARFLLPAFPAFLPVARLVARLPRWLQMAFVVVITGVSTWWSLDILGSQLSP